MRCLVMGAVLLAAAACASPADPVVVATVAPLPTTSPRVPQPTPSTSVGPADGTDDDEPAESEETVVTAPPLPESGRCRGLATSAAGEFVVLLLPTDPPEFTLCDPGTGFMAPPIYWPSGQVIAAVLNPDDDRIEQRVLFGGTETDGSWFGAVLRQRIGDFEVLEEVAALAGRTSLECRDGNVVSIAFEFSGTLLAPTFEWTATVDGAPDDAGRLRMVEDAERVREIVGAECDGILLGTSHRFLVGAHLLSRLLDELDALDVGFDHSIDPTAVANATIDGTIYGFEIDLTDGVAARRRAESWIASCGVGFLQVEPTPAPALEATLERLAGCRRI